MMVVCLILDINGGMMFNERRQSADSVLYKYIVEESNGKTIWMNEYSKSQFDVVWSERIVVDELFLEKAAENDWCFVENIALKKYENRIDKLILFRWDKIYPADLFFDILVTNGKWRLVEITEFPGNSHKIITKEVWINADRNEGI